MISGNPDIASLEVKDDLDAAGFRGSHHLPHGLDAQIAISLEARRLNLETGNLFTDRLYQRTGKRGDRADPGFQIIRPSTQLVGEPLEHRIKPDADRGLEPVDPCQQPVGGMRTRAGCVCRHFQEVNSR